MIENAYRAIIRWIASQTRKWTLLTKSIIIKTKITYALISNESSIYCCNTRVTIGVTTASWTWIFTSLTLNLCFRIISCIAYTYAQLHDHVAINTTRAIVLICWTIYTRAYARLALIWNLSIRVFACASSWWQIHIYVHTSCAIILISATVNTRRYTRQTWIRIKSISLDTTCARCFWGTV